MRDGQCLHIRKLVGKVLGLSGFPSFKNPETRKLVNEDSNYHVMRGVMEAFTPCVDSCSGMQTRDHPEPCGTLFGKVLEKI